MADKVTKASKTRGSKGKKLRPPMYVAFVRPGAVYVKIGNSRVASTSERIKDSVNIDHDSKGNPVGYEFLDCLSVSVQEKE